MILLGVVGNGKLCNSTILLLFVCIFAGTCHVGILQSHYQVSSVDRRQMEIVSKINYFWGIFQAFPNMDNSLARIILARVQQSRF